MPATHRPNPPGIDPDTVLFTPGALAHASRVGFSIEQMRAALREPRWINDVRSQPDPINQSQPRYRYCGHGVAVVLEGQHAIAVIADNPTKTPKVLQHS